MIVWPQVEQLLDRMNARPSLTSPEIRTEPPNCVGSVQVGDVFLKFVYVKDAGHFLHVQNHDLLKFIIRQWYTFNKNFEHQNEERHLIYSLS